MHLVSYLCLCCTCRRLDSNALICDCQVMWLTQMLKQNEGHTEAAVTCASPSDVRGKSLLSLSEETFHCRRWSQAEVIISLN